jgi:rare lipoprotein A
MSTLVPTSAWPRRPRRPGPSAVSPQQLVLCFSLASVAFATLEPGDALAARKRTKYARRESGLASWYGPGFHGRRTASGERFDPTEFAAAHRTLPFGTRVRVTNLENGRRVVVRINDRGPFKKDRVLDVTPVAAQKLGFKHIGVARVKIEVLRVPKRVADAAPGQSPGRTASSTTRGAGERCASTHCPDATTATIDAVSEPATLL